ncbi:putative reverse transcriptase domain-containing protein [Tanacetum coccineum]
MPSRMTTQSIRRASAALRGGRTGGRTSRGGGRTRGQSGDQSNGRIDGQGAIVYTRWVEKMESVQDMSRCRDNQKVKYTAGSFIGSMSWLGMVATTKPKTIQRAMQKAGTLTYEAVRNRSLKKNPEKRGNNGEPNRDRSTRDEIKRTRTGNDFATTTNPVRIEYNGTIPKCVSCNLHHPPEIPCRACFNCGHPGHMEKDCRAALRMVNPVNARNPNTAPKACYECGGTDHFKAACPRLNQAQRPGGNRPNQVIANNEG